MSYFQRKKQFFVSIVNSIKGFVRSVSGTPPITLEDCVDDKSVINYQLYGNSVQDGEPSPDNPVEVVSVGEKTINLFNPNITPTKIGTTNYYGLDTTGWEGNYAICARLKEGKTIPTSGYFGMIGGVNKALWFVNNGKSVDSMFSPKRNLYWAVPHKVGYEFWGIGCYPSSTWDSFMDAFDVWVVKGDYPGYLEIPDYEPYGYKIPVTAHGKNLIPEWKNGWIVVGTGVLNETSYPNRRYTDYIPIESNTKYYISGGGANSNYTLYDENFGYLTGQIFNSSRHIIHSTAKYIRIAHTNTNTGDIQLELGDTATEYEPYKEPVTTNLYLNEPLRAIGDYKDYIDFENGKLVRNIAESQFLSRYLASKSGSFSGTVTGFLVSNTSPFGKAKTGLPKNIAYGFNSIGEVARNANDYNTREPNIVGWMPNAAGNTVSFFAMPISFLTDNGYTNDLTGAEDWVDAQNTISPIMITYILETPIEETINLSNLPTFKGNTTYTINTTVQPNMVVNYYSTTKGE